MVDGMEKLLAGKVALVAGATRGAGRRIAVQLGAAGATVYVTGRTTKSQRSEMNRPETTSARPCLSAPIWTTGWAVSCQSCGVPSSSERRCDRYRRFLCR
jgi:NAD(P)-dependent dehydrogenase (short-subunit alcohol dehydrogenase family)